MFILLRTSTSVVYILGVNAPSFFFVSVSYCVCVIFCDAVLGYIEIIRSLL